MKQVLSVVTRKGQITLPAEIRKRLGIAEGDKVALSLTEEGEGSIILRPVRSVAELTFGAAKAQGQPEDFEEFRRQFEEHLAEQGACAKSGEP